jgi:hypothetical protein
MTNLIEPSLASGDVPESARQPSERRLDEEALSRMDDEGGSNDPAVISHDGQGRPPLAKKCFIQSSRNVTALINPNEDAKRRLLNAIHQCRSGKL